MTTYVYPRSLITIGTTGLATEAKQDTTITAIGLISNKIAALGQAAMAASAPVVIASNQTSVPIKLRDANDAAIALGAAAMAASIPVVMATNQSAIPVATSALAVVDQIDATPLLDTSLTNIPASAGNPVTVVASLAAQAKKIVSVEDIGEYIGLYTGAALSEVLYCILPLGGGEIEVSIPIATRISLRAMKNAAITSSSIALNFLG